MKQEMITIQKEGHEIVKKKAKDNLEEDDVVTQINKSFEDLKHKRVREI